jgi:hypothetical protein
VREGTLKAALRVVERGDPFVDALVAALE